MRLRYNDAQCRNLLFAQCRNRTRFAEAKGTMHDLCITNTLESYQFVANFHQNIVAKVLAEAGERYQNDADSLIKNRVVIGLNTTYKNQTSVMRRIKSTIKII